MLKLLEAQPKHVLYLQDFETFDTETTKEQEKPQSEVRRNLDFPSALGVRLGMDNVCIGGAGGRLPWVACLCNLFTFIGVEGMAVAYLNLCCPLLTVVTFHRVLNCGITA